MGSNKNRHRTRSKSRERYRERDRERDRDYYSSSSRRHSKSNSKHSRKSNKHHRRSSSSEDSSSPSSRDSRSSSKYSSRSSKPRAPSSESNSRSAPTTTSSIASNTTQKGIDLMDCKVQKALETIEEDSFNQNTFFSTKDREAPEKVIIDLNAETVTFKPPDPMEAIKEEIFHPNFLGDQEQKQEKWIRKLLMYRQKYMSE